jgi:CheY-specific phosphatase CheX
VGHFEPPRPEPALLALSAELRTDIRCVMRSVTERARRYFSQELGLEVATIETEPGAIEAPASFLCLKGMVSGTLILQARPSAVRALLARLLGGDDEAADEEVLLGEALNEVLNILVGNVTQDLAEAGLRIQVHPPFAAIWDGRQGTPLSGERLCCRYALCTTAGEFLFAFAVPQEAFNQVECL